ncbi:hypothetical protein C9413_30380 [Rhizobium sp. SEMIA 4085]|nr:hypothetical protein [Rhizobium sp. SEMIA 4085]
MSLHNNCTRIERDFAAAGERAREAGFKSLTLHFAHGDLPQSFLSIHSIRRDCEHGGTAENRTRFTVKTRAACIGRVEMRQEYIALVRRAAGRVALPCPMYDIVGHARQPIRSVTLYQKSFSVGTHIASRHLQTRHDQR